MIGPVATNPASDTSVRGAGFTALTGGGAGAAFVTEDTAGLPSPQLATNTAAPNAMNTIELRILPLRLVFTTLASTTLSHKATKIAFEITHTPLGTIPH